MPGTAQSSFPARQSINPRKKGTTPGMRYFVNLIASPEHGPPAVRRLYISRKHLCANSVARICKPYICEALNITYIACAYTVLVICVRKQRLNLQHNFQSSRAKLFSLFYLGMTQIWSSYNKLANAHDQKLVRFIYIYIY